MTIMKSIYKFTSKHLQYRTIQEEDSEILVSWRSDLSLIRYYRNSSPITMEMHQSWFQNRYNSDNARWDFMAFDGLVPVGFVALLHMDFDKKIAEINYTIGNKDYTGRSLSVEMIQSLCDFGKSVFGIQEFIAEIHRDNVVSQKSAVSSGFILEDTKGNFWKYRRRMDGFIHNCND